jgi:hypothetical protein
MVVAALHHWRQLSAMEFEFDPREAEDYLRASAMPARRELVYRLALRRICARCRGDRAFKERTDALLNHIGKDQLPKLLGEAREVEAELTARTPH